MRTLTISLEDITGVPAQEGDVVWVSSPVRRPSEGRTVVPREHPVDLIAGEGSVQVHPGPLQVRFDLAGITFREGPTARVVMPEGEGEESLADLLSAAHDWTPEEMSEFARLRADAVDAAERAETAASSASESASDAGEDRQQTGLDRAATGEDRVATGEDRVQTGLDRVAATESRDQSVGAKNASIIARDTTRDYRDQVEGLVVDASAHATTATAAAAAAEEEKRQAAEYTATSVTLRDQAQAARDVAVANGLMWRGPWDPTVEYVPQNAVTDEGSSWRAIAPSVGVKPEEGDYWSLVARRGAAGESGISEVVWGDIDDKPETFPPAEHTHSAATLGSGGSRSASTFLNGDDNWVVPYSVMTTAEAETGTASTGRLLSPTRLREAIQHRVTGAAATAVSAIGQALNRAATKAEARAAIDAVGDASELTGALTDQVDASEVIVTAQNGTSGLAASIDAMFNNLLWLGGEGGLGSKSDVGHTHTPAQVGLGNVDNTSDADKPVSTATQAALDAKVTNAGGASGLWVGTAASLPSTGTAGVLYVTTD